jgi:hypothetical protein
MTPIDMPTTGVIWGARHRRRWWCRWFVPHTLGVVRQSPSIFCVAMEGRVLVHAQRKCTRVGIYGGGAPPMASRGVTTAIRPAARSISISTTGVPAFRIWMKDRLRYR